MTEQSTFLPDPILTDPISTDPARELPRVACRGCGSPMAWVSSTKGGTVSLDPAPVRDGNLVFEPGTERPTVRYLKKGEVVPAGTARYRSHFSTCERAADFRRAV